jgi:hypothetical protein
MIPKSFGDELIKTAGMWDVLGRMTTSTRARRAMEELRGDRKIFHGGLGAFVDSFSNVHGKARAGLAARQGKKLLDQATSYYNDAKGGLSGVFDSLKGGHAAIKAKERELGRSLSFAEKSQLNSGNMKSLGESARKVMGVFGDKNRNLEFMERAGKAKSSFTNALHPENTLVGKSIKGAKVGAGGLAGAGVIGAGTIGYDAVTRDPSLLYNAGMGGNIRKGADFAGSWY